MVLKLYGLHMSYFVCLVAAVLIEKKVPFELVQVDVLKREQKLPEYLGKHPFGQVPCIDDDGFIVYEARATCYYIASKYSIKGHRYSQLGSKPVTVHSTSRLYLWKHLTSMRTPNKLRKNKRYRGETPDKEAFDKHIANLSLKLDVYDKILSKQKYLVGDEITLVDLYHLPTGCQLASVGCDVMCSKPNVARWFKDLTSRASWQAVQNDIKSTN